MPHWRLKAIWKNSENEELLWVLKNYSHCMTRQIARDKMYLLLPGERWRPPFKIGFCLRVLLYCPSRIKDWHPEMNSTSHERTEKISMSTYQSQGTMYACITQCKSRKRAEGGFIHLGENGKVLFTFSGRKHVITADDSSKFWDLGYAKALWSFG